MRKREIRKGHIFFKRRRAYRLLDSIGGKTIFVDNIDIDPNDGWWATRTFCGLYRDQLNPTKINIEDIGKKWFDIDICKSCLRIYHTRRYESNLFLKYKNTQLAVDKIKSLAERSIDLKYIY